MVEFEITLVYKWSLFVLITQRLDYSLCYGNVALFQSVTKGYALLGFLLCIGEEFGLINGSDHLGTSVFQFRIRSIG